MGFAASNGMLRNSVSGLAFARQNTLGGFGWESFLRLKRQR